MPDPDHDRLLAASAKALAHPARLRILRLLLAASAKALAHPARLRILRLLLATPGCIGGDIVDAVGLAQSTVSEHLRILKAAGIITGEISGPCTCYALDPSALGPLADFIGALTPPPAASCCVPDRVVAGRGANPETLS